MRQGRRRGDVLTAAGSGIHLAHEKRQRGRSTGGARGGDKTVVGTGPCMSRKEGGSSTVRGTRSSSRPALWRKWLEAPGRAAVAGEHRMHARCAVREGADKQVPCAGGCGPPWASAVGLA
jgi:hypothetical protein